MIKQRGASAPLYLYKEMIGLIIKKVAIGITMAIVTAFFATTTVALWRTEDYGVASVIVLMWLATVVISTMEADRDDKEM